MEYARRRVDSPGVARLVVADPDVACARPDKRLDVRSVVGEQRMILCGV